MARFRLEIVRPECIGCESCVAVCPEKFRMADDGLSTLIEGTRVGDNDEEALEEEGCTREAAEKCPVTCIHLFEGEKQII